ncbi:MAG: fatty acyl-AMP ligase [Steroidobacteraceae bacterium]
MQRPGQRAFVYLERGEREAASLTFAELHHRAGVIAAALHDRGLAGQRVILAYPTCLEFVATLFGCFYAGVIPIPSAVADRGYGADRLRAILSDAGAAAILTLRSLVVPDELCLATDALMDSGAAAPETKTVGSDIALLQYTSGSTGNPHGVMVTHANLMHNQQALAAVLGLRPGETLVHWLPLYHDMGLVGGVLHAVYAGLTAYLMPPRAFLQKPMRWLHAIHRRRAAISMAPCFAYRLCAERGRAAIPDDLDLSGWRLALCGGELVRPDWLERFATTFRPARFDPRMFVPTYGLAEATLMATAWPAGSGLNVQRPRARTATGQNGDSDEWDGSVVCCGHPVQGLRAVIVDPACRQVRAGEAGEIWLQGSSVAAGYWNRTDETRETFRATLTDETEAGEWLRTGDLGYLTSDGLVVTGRIKEILVIRGANYDPHVIEAAAQASHPALAPGAGGAFTVTTDDGEAVIVLASEIARTAMRDVAAGDIAAAVVEAVSRRCGLTLYDLVLLRPGALPRTTSGKIRRHACRQRYLAGEFAALAAIELPILGRYRPRGR